MLKVALALLVLCLLPITGMFFLKLIDKSCSLAMAYVGGALWWIAVFALITRMMASRGAPLGVLLLKLLFIMEAALLFLDLTLAFVRGRRRGSRERVKAQRAEADDRERAKARSEEADGKNGKLCRGLPWLSLPLIFDTAAVVLFAAAGVLALRYVPDGAVTMMADINSIGFFGVTGDDPMVMLGYYLKNLLGLSTAQAVCMAVPLCFYAAFILLMKGLADCFFAEDKCAGSLCFLAEACLVFLGDCGYSAAYIPLHGFHRMEGVVMGIALPLVFWIGMELLQKGGNGKVHGAVCAGLLLLCIVAAAFFEKRALGLMLCSLFIFVLLIIMRRWLPWLKASE